MREARGLGRGGKGEGRDKLEQKRSDTEKGAGGKGEKGGDSETKEGERKPSQAASGSEIRTN